MVSFIKKLSLSLSKKERLILISALVILVVSGIFLLIETINKITTLVPNNGGNYIEGVVGQPSFINPVLAKNGTVDKDLTKLLFANVLDLADNLKKSSDFKEWTLRIKEGVKWQDGSDLTSDDIIFTVQMIQNPDTLSPLAADWQNIQASRVSELEIKFKLPSPYSSFENILSNLRPLPKKIFADISPSNIKLSSYNLEPVGSGPYIYKSLEKKRDGFIQKMVLERNIYYQTIKTPTKIDRITFKFFENEQELVRDFNLGLVDGFGTSNIKTASDLKISAGIEDVPSFKYYSLFFNSNANPLLSDPNIRKAVSCFIDRERIKKDVFDGRAELVNGPILPFSEFYDQEITKYSDCNSEKGLLVAAQSGWQFNLENKQLEKYDSKTKSTSTLSLKIKFPDVSLVEEMARLIGQDLEKLGIKVELIKVDPQLINEEVIKSRDYETLLFGNILMKNPDLFSFWHSSGKFYPGLNLALYESSFVDARIEELKKVSDWEEKNELFSQIQNRIAMDYPAAFLVSPDFIYIHKKSISGIVIPSLSLPEDRFDQITDWYVKTRRVLK